MVKMTQRIKATLRILRAIVRMMEARPIRATRHLEQRAKVRLRTLAMKKVRNLPPKRP